MAIESPQQLEQTPEQIEEIRKGIRELYDLEEVKQSALDHWYGRVDEYDLAQFQQLGKVTVKRPGFAFGFYPLIVSEGSGDSRNDLKLDRSFINDEGKISSEGNIFINASSRYRIRVIEYRSWVWDNTKNIGDEPRRWIDGQEAIDTAREVIISYNQQHLPLPQNK